MTIELTTLTNHPYADIFPMIEGEALSKLASDIRDNGLLNPIALYEGKILDGRNRFKACGLAGIAPRFEEFKGKSALNFVLSTNLQRRHLNSSQLAAVALEVERVLADEAKVRQLAALKQNQEQKTAVTDESTVVEIIPQRTERESITIAKHPIGSNPLERSVAQAAKIVGGTNPRYVQDAKKIKQQAPELFEKIRTGELTIPAAKRKLNPLPESGNLAHCGGSIKHSEMMQSLLEILTDGLEHGDNAIELLDRICMGVGGVQFYLPRLDQRNQSICRALRQGASAEQLAVEYELTPRAIMTIKSMHCR